MDRSKSSGDDGTSTVDPRARIDLVLAQISLHLARFLASSPSCFPPKSHLEGCLRERREGDDIERERGEESGFGVKEWGLGHRERGKGKRS